MLLDREKIVELKVLDARSTKPPWANFDDLAGVAPQMGGGTIRLRFTKADREFVTAARGAVPLLIADAERAVELLRLVSTSHFADDCWCHETRYRSEGHGDECQQVRDFLGSGPREL